MLLRALLFLLLCTAALSASPLRISVLYFDNTAPTERSAQLGRALADILSADLARASGITVIERSNLEKITRELALGQSGFIDEKSAPAVGKMLGAQYIVMGSFTPQRRDVAVTWKLAAVETGAILGGGTLQGSALHMTRLTALIETDLLAALSKLSADIAAPINTADSTLLVSIDQIADYGTALDLADRGEYAKARDLAKKLAAEAPAFSSCVNFLAGLETRLAAYDAVRAQLMTATRNEPLTWQSYQTITSSYASAMQFTKLLNWCLERRNTHTLPASPDNFPYSCEEQNDQNIVLSAYTTKRQDLFIREAEHFLATWPASTFYGSVRTWLANAAQEAARSEAKKKEAATTIGPVLEKLAAAKGWNADLARIEAAGIYFQAGMHKEALQMYRAIKPASLANMGLTPDFVLYQQFSCCCALLDEKEAKKLLGEVQSNFPLSDFAATMAMQYEQISE